MSVTLEVSRPERSRDVRAEQPSNMELMSVTLEVSRPERLRYVGPEQSTNMANMRLMSVTPEVDKDPTIEMRLLTPCKGYVFLQLLAVHPSSSSRYLTPLSRTFLINSDHSNVLNHPPLCTRMAPSS